jgi:hypothetical protein
MKQKNKENYIYLSGYAIEHLNDIKTLLKYKKYEDLKLYKKITS